MAAPSPMTLALGFVGSDAVHKDTARPLLGDLIEAHRRDYRGAKILFLFSVEPTFTETMADIADYALNNGHKIGLVGHSEFLEHPKVAEFLPEAQGNLFRLEDEKSVHKGMAGALGVWDLPQLILIGDPNEDDYVYASFRAVTRKQIVTRSLIDGLDKVEMEPEEEEQAQMSPRQHDDDFEEEEEFDDEDLDDVDDEVDDEEEDDSEEEEAEDDESDEDDDEEGPQDLDEEESDEEDESDEDEDESDEEDEIEDDVEDLDEEDESEDEESEDEDDEEEEEQMPARSKSKSSSGTRWTQAKLERLADNDYDKFRDVVDEFRVTTGRGIRVPKMIEGILEAQDGKKPARKTTSPKTTTRRSTSKPASTRKTTTAKKRGRPAATGTKSAKTTRSTTTTRTKASANGSTPSMAQLEAAVERGVLKAFRKMARSSS